MASSEVIEGDLGVAMTFRDVRVTTRAGRTLLDGVDGIAVPGTLTALMGASGAGKTTLLNTLLARNLKGLRVEGDIRVNGHALGSCVVSVSGYVQQEDIFFGSLTVGEHLNLHAHLRLPSEMSAKERKERVTKVAEDMLLSSTLKTRIGEPGEGEKGISGGEAKRLAFATALLSEPAILFCDEPTTGLDSYTAKLVIQQLVRLTTTYNKTIVCTIHQPASEIFELFDRVLLLAVGRVAFFGSPAEAVGFFGQAGHCVPPHSNLADHFINTLAVMPGQEDRCREQCNRICERFRCDTMADMMQDDIDTFSAPFPLRRTVCASWPRIAVYLFRRSLMDILRHPFRVHAKILRVFFIGIFIGLLYFKTEDDQTGIRHTCGVMFFVISELTVAALFPIQGTMPADFPIVAREYNDGLYPVSAYYVGKVLTFLMLFSIDGMILISIFFFMVCFSPAAFPATLLVGLAVEICAASVGVALSAACPSYVVAVSVTGPILTGLQIAGGLMSRVDSLPAAVSWVQYASWFRYGFESMLSAHMTLPRYERLECDQGNNVSCFRSGQEVIADFSFSASNFSGNLVMMFLMTFCFYCFGYAALVLRVILAR